jgi:quinol-cytochrome oxidoreductase complex cytochrome b subunit
MANKIETGLSSDAKKDAKRVVFVTKKTSAKVVGERKPQLMAYPHLLVREAVAFQVLVIAMVVVALFWDAPLEQLANPLLTPNPAKAPWYFLGLQELLHFFPPFVAGILIPTLVIVALVIIPYFNVNIEGEPIWARRPARNLRIAIITVVVLLAFLAAFDAWTILAPTAIVAALLLFSYTARQGEKAFLQTVAKKPLSWWVMTWFIAVAICLTVVGTFLRGPGWSWVWPWRAHAG